MDVKSCRSCGRLFNYLQGQPICPACRKRVEEKFVEVRDYIRANESATMQQISDDNDVSIKQLKQWIREERLTFSEKSPVGIECENCGAMIRTGRFCGKCKHNMVDTLKKMYVMPTQERTLHQRDKDKMRFLDKNQD